MVKYKISLSTTRVFYTYLLVFLLAYGTAIIYWNINGVIEFMFISIGFWAGMWYFMNCIEDKLEDWFIENMIRDKYEKNIIW